MFDPLKPPWGGVGQICLGLNDSQINPHNYACKIWLRSDGLVEKGGYTYTQTKGKGMIVLGLFSKKYLEKIM